VWMREGHHDTIWLTIIGPGFTRIRSRVGLENAGALVLFPTRKERRVKQVAFADTGNTRASRESIAGDSDPTTVSRASAVGRSHTEVKLKSNSLRHVSTIL
jgi:hypothetical protein